jgi:hypothetical protein
MFGGTGEARPLGIDGVIFLTVFGLFWWAGVALVDGTLASGLYRRARAAYYATTTGVVTRSTVRVSRGDSSTSYAPELRYTYEVGGRKFTGTRDRFDFYDRGKDEADVLVAAHPVGARVTIYFDPANPAESLLHPGLDGRDLFIAMCAVPFNLVGLAIAYSLGSGVREMVSPSPTGGCRLWEDGLQVRVRMPVAPPLVCGLGAGGGAAMLAIFALLIGFHPFPSTAVMGVVWGVILAAGVAAYAARRRRAAQGKFDLVLDPIGRTMTLPRMMGREEEVVVRCRDVRAIEVDRVIPPKSGIKRYYEYCPTLVLARLNGQPLRERIGKWPDRSSAERFAAWLRERIGGKTDSGRSG